MRRWLSGVAAAGAAVLALAGCGSPAGVDGDLVDDWEPVGQPTVFVPEAGTCHPRLQEVGYLSTYRPVACDRLHQAETAYVGSFVGADAERAGLPPAGSSPMRAAYRDCDARVSAFVGADWRSGRLAVVVVAPSRHGWTGGARWYRCDVAEIDGLDNAEFVDRTGSLNGALRGPSALRHGCFAPTVRRQDVQAMVAVVCTRPHRAEFAGVYLAPDGPYDVFDRDAGRIHRGCYAVIARFAEVPNDSRIDERVGSIYHYPSESEWKAGNRGVQCFLWMKDRALTRSVKAAGTRGLPLR